MTWEIDPAHSSIEFSVTHLAITNVKGRFTEMAGTLYLDPEQPTHSWVKAQVNSASVQTGTPRRDAHIRSADFFDTTKFPTIAFQSTQVKPIDQTHCVLDGNLSLRGVTRVVSFQVGYTGRGKDPLTGAWRVGLFARTTIDRRDFGITFNQINEGIMLVGHTVWIEMSIEAIFVG